MGKMKLTKDQFKKALSFEGILQDGNVEMLSYLFYSDQCEATSPQITQALGLGDIAGPANSIIGNLGRRIAKFHSIEPENIDKPMWWRAIANGEQRPDGFFWKLKENFIDALIELQLIDDRNDKLYPEIVTEASALYEGKAKLISVNVYERNPIARKLCIKHHGSSCVICGFDFQKQFGALGKGFIHVHHLKELSSIGDDYKVDPIHDLRPVCPNCHAMLHQERPALCIEKLRNIISENSEGNT